MDIKRKVRSDSVGIIAMAHHHPQHTMIARDIFKQERVELDPDNASEIEIEQVHVFGGQWRSELSLAAARECILRANLKATDIDVIVDFSVLPQDYVVPSWCMSNKIQYEIGAKNAFNLGFGGGGDYKSPDRIEVCVIAYKGGGGCQNGIVDRE